MSLLVEKLRCLEIQNELLKQRIKTVMEKAEKPIEKIKSLDSLKKEIRAFFSIDGHSKILKTKSILKILSCLLCVTTLLVACLFYVTMSFLNFYQYDVVTQIKSKEVETLPFPAITLCLVDYNYSLDLSKKPHFSEAFATRDLKDFLLECDFEDQKCSIDDFEHFTMYFQYEAIQSHLNCYKFNGGKNASKHQAEILQSTKFRAFSGLILQLNMSRRSFFFFHIGDNNVQPLFTELMKTITPGNNIYIAIKKTHLTWSSKSLTRKSHTERHTVMIFA